MTRFLSAVLILFGLAVFLSGAWFQFSLAWAYKNFARLDAVVTEVTGPETQGGYYTFTARYETGGALHQRSFGTRRTPILGSGDTVSIAHDPAQPGNANLMFLDEGSIPKDPLPLALVGLVITGGGVWLWRRSRRIAGAKSAA